jgi:hypothetical protein
MLIVYWIDPETRQAHYEEFGDGTEELKKALNACQTLRKAGGMAVTSIYHTPNDVAGGIVQDGKLPNGEPYTWKKRR